MPETADPNSPRSESRRDEMSSRGLDRRRAFLIDEDPSIGPLVLLKLRF